MDDCPFLSLVTLLLEIKILFENGCETIPFQQSDLFDDFWPVRRYILKIDQHRHVVTVLRIGQQIAVLPFEQFIGAVLLQFLVEL